MSKKYQVYLIKTFIIYMYITSANRTVNVNERVQVRRNFVFFVPSKCVPIYLWISGCESVFEK